MSVTFSELQMMLESCPPAPVRQSSVALFDFTLQADEQVYMDHLYRWQRKTEKDTEQKPFLSHPRVALYASHAGNDSVVETKKTIAHIAQGQHAVHRLALSANCDIRVYEMDMDRAPQVLSETEAAHAISYGLMACDETVDILILETLSGGADTWLDQQTTHIKQKQKNDILPYLAQIGRVDLCALVGAALSARMACIPILAGYRLTGFLSTVLEKLFSTNANDLPFIMIDSSLHHFPNQLQPMIALNHLQTLCRLANFYQPKKPVLHQLSAKSV
jgi:hypothetical protein